jgi:hypothetical protein
MKLAAPPPGLAALVDVVGPSAALRACMTREREGWRRGKLYIPARPSPRILLVFGSEAAAVSASVAWGCTRIEVPTLSRAVCTMTGAAREELVVVLAGRMPLDEVARRLRMSWGLVSSARGRRAVDAALLEACIEDGHTRPMAVIVASAMLARLGARGVERVPDASLIAGVEAALHPLVCAYLVAEAALSQRATA